MAKDTSKQLCNVVIYEIYVRDHGKNGTFKDVEEDLERIRDLGADYIWFMPIHPIGKLNRKGHLGCPYSISDYEKINPEYGTKADFKHLIEKAHQLGLKVMMDVVINHTAWDSKLIQEHLEWFHMNKDGKISSTVPDWTDVVDLVYPNSELEDYLIRVLKSWAKTGLDGFRCDVASLVPVDFWKKARKEINKIKTDFVWLAESVDIGFIESRRQAGLFAQSDGELYQAFDITYDYDLVAVFQAAVTEKIKIKRYLEMLRLQSAIYPENALKLRYVENHDRPRIMELASNKNAALAWTVFQSFLPGPYLIYGGQESGVTIKPDLFEANLIEWGDYSLTPWLQKVLAFKKNKIQVDGKFFILEDEPCIQAIWQNEKESFLGIFNVSDHSGNIELNLQDGAYTDLITGHKVEVLNKKIRMPENAVIFKCDPMQNVSSFYSKLIDFKPD